jgi:hypothetical protein
VDGVRFSGVVSTLDDLVVDLTIADGGRGDQSFLGTGEVESGSSSSVVRTDAVSGQLKGKGLRAKCSEFDRGVDGKAGTGGGVVPGVSFRAVEGERGRRRKNVFFFLVDASER